MTDYKRIIANNITELRKAVPLTQAELAEKLNYSDKAVSKWERGESIPDVIVLKQIADVFGVTVDYLLEEVHEQNDTPKRVSHRLNRTHILIAGLACMLTFLIATLFFVILDLTTDMKRLWLAFVYCVPICSILLIVFNTMWGNKRHNYYYISLLVWSTLASIYLSIGDYGNWPIFIIGIPGQVIIVLWSFMKAKFWKKDII